MRNDQLALGGLLLVGLAAAVGGPKIVNKARLTIKRATGATYRDGVSSPGKRATADPARGMPA